MAVTMVDKTDAMLASETADKITSTFGVKEYDVSPGILCCPILCPQTLTLEAEEVVYIRKSPCDTATKRMPYGQLGSVDAKTACGCCIAVDSQLTAGSDEGISPKCGCETALVKEIVEELKARMKARGDTGNIKRAEQTLDVVEKVQADVASLTAKVDAILAHLSIPQPATMAR